jgi:hypothetical protein
MTTTLFDPIPLESEAALADLRRIVEEGEAALGGFPSNAQLMHEIETGIVQQYGPVPVITIEDVIASLAQRQQRLALETRQAAISSALALYGTLGRHAAVLALPVRTEPQDDATEPDPVTPTPGDDAATTPTDEELGVIEAEIVEEPTPAAKPVRRRNTTATARARRTQTGK